VGLGADLPHFMEQGLTGSNRVIAVCSDTYIEKANAGKRGVGYEKKIMTADLMKDAVSDHIVPVIRGAVSEPPVPTFLSGARYVDFRDDVRWDAAYQVLVWDLYGQRVHPRPALGRNPFVPSDKIAVAQALRFDPTCFLSDTLSGEVTFAYENNGGRFVIGRGEYSFTIDVSTAGHGSVHIYNDPTSISTVALAPSTVLADVQSPETYDSSSRSRTARVGDSVVLVNMSGRSAAIEITEVTTRDTADGGVAKLRFRYAVADGVD